MTDFVILLAGVLIGVLALLAFTLWLRGRGGARVIRRREVIYGQVERVAKLVSLEFHNTFVVSTEVAVPGRVFGKNKGEVVGILRGRVALGVDLGKADFTPQSIVLERKKVKLVLPPARILYCEPEFPVMWCLREPFQGLSDMKSFRGSREKEDMEAHLVESMKANISEEGTLLRAAERQIKNMLEYLIPGCTVEFRGALAGGEGGPVAELPEAQGEAGKPEKKPKKEEAEEEKPPKG